MSQSHKFMTTLISMHCNGASCQLIDTLQDIQCTKHEEGHLFPSTDGTAAMQKLWRQWHGKKMVQRIHHGNQWQQNATKEVMTTNRTDQWQQTGKKESMATNGGDQSTLIQTNPWQPMEVTKIKTAQTNSWQPMEITKSKMAQTNPWQPTEFTKSKMAQITPCNQRRSPKAKWLNQIYCNQNRQLI